MSVRLSIEALPGQGDEVTCALVFRPVSAQPVDPVVVIERPDAQDYMLGARGWAVASDGLRPRRVELRDDALWLMFGPEVSRHVERGTPVKVRELRSGLSGNRIWPGIARGREPTPVVGDGAPTGEYRGASSDTVIALAAARASGEAAAALVAAERAARILADQSSEALRSAAAKARTAAERAASEASTAKATSKRDVAEAAADRAAAARRAAEAAAEEAERHADAEVAKEAADRAAKEAALADAAAERASQAVKKTTSPEVEVAVAATRAAAERATAEASVARGTIERRVAEAAADRASAARRAAEAAAEEAERRADAEAAKEAADRAAKEAALAGAAAERASQAAKKKTSPQVQVAVAAARAAAERAAEEVSVAQGTTERRVAEAAADRAAAARKEAEEQAARAATDGNGRRPLLMAVVIATVLPAAMLVGGVAAFWRRFFPTSATRRSLASVRARGWAGEVQGLQHFENADIEMENPGGDFLTFAQLQSNAGDDSSNVIRLIRTVEPGRPLVAGIDFAWLPRIWGAKLRTPVEGGRPLNSDNLVVANVAQLHGRWQASGQPVDQSRRSQAGIDLQRGLSNPPLLAVTDLGAGHILRMSDFRSDSLVRVVVLRNSKDRGSFLAASDIAVEDRYESSLPADFLRADQGLSPEIWYGLQGREAQRDLRRSEVVNDAIRWPRVHIFPETATDTLTPREILELAFIATSFPSHAGIMLHHRQRPEVKALEEVEFRRVWRALQTVLINELYARHGLNFAHGLGDNPNWGNDETSNARKDAHEEFVRRLNWYPMVPHPSEDRIPFVALQTAARERMKGTTCNQNSTCEERNFENAVLARNALLTHVGAPRDTRGIPTLSPNLRAQVSTVKIKFADIRF